MHGREQIKAFPRACMSFGPPQNTTTLQLIKRCREGEVKRETRESQKATKTWGADAGEVEHKWER